MQDILVISISILTNLTFVSMLCYTVTIKNIKINYQIVCLRGLGVTCSPRDPRFVGSNPNEVDGFFQDVKILSSNPPGGTEGPESEISGSLKNLKPEKISSEQNLIGIFTS